MKYILWLIGLLLAASIASRLPSVALKGGRLAVKSVSVPKNSDLAIQSTKRADWIEPYSIGEAKDHVEIIFKWHSMITNDIERERDRRGK